MRLSDLGEFGFIDRIAAAVKNAPSVVISIGDDAAAVKPKPGYLSLLTSDMLIEEVHFTRAHSDPRTLGRKSLSVNLSDLAAMGANPSAFLLSLAIPDTISLEYLDNFMAGMLERADQFGITLIGGDTCASKGGLAISVTAIGEQLPERVVRRSGAKQGDLIFVTGTVGDSALGLELLRRGDRTGTAVMRHLDPEPRVKAGIALAESALVTSMIDVSDGLLADLGHILKQSGVGARLDLGNIPLSDEYSRQATLLTEDPFSLALSGGEDYELLFTSPPHLKDQVYCCMSACNVAVSLIGEINGGEPRVAIVTAEGTEYLPQKRGFNHFA